MKILVAIKRVIDYNAKVRINHDGSDVDLSNIKMAINPFCEIAVEEAVRLKEAGTALTVTAVSIGPDSCVEQLRTALAIGADEAIHIKTEQMPESLEVAKLLARLVDSEKPDLVIMGKQSIDTDNNQTGQMLAALLDWPQGTFASNIVLENSHIQVTREIDGGLQTLSLNLPAVVTTDLRLNEPRYIALPNIVKAKRKPITCKTPEELGVTIKKHTHLLSVSLPAQRQAGEIVTTIDQLLDKLKHEAKVI